MVYLIKVKESYVLSSGLWTKFTLFKEDAKRFPDRKTANDAVEELFDPSFYRNFDRHDVEVVPYTI